MDLSVVIVNWNTKEILSECLQSLTLDTSLQMAEIILVDNASSDGSPVMVKERFPHVKLICNDQNLGFAKANNIGIRLSTGRYICLVNSDVIVLKDCFNSMLAYMDEHPEIGMLGPKILNPDRTLQPSCMGFPTLWNMFCRALALDKLFPGSKLFGGRLMNFWAHDTVSSAEVLNGCFLMVRREALEQVGLLDENFFFYGEDIDWCKRFHDAGWNVMFSPSAEAIHYGGASSSSAPIRFYIEMQRADLQYWKKHHGMPSWILYVSISCLHHALRFIGQSVSYVFLPSQREKTLPKIKRSLASVRWLFQPSYYQKIGQASGSNQ